MGSESQYRRRPCGNFVAVGLGCISSARGGELWRADLGSDGKHDGHDPAHFLFSRFERLDRIRRFH